ncbi:LysR family transcriptional regulator [Leisingera daeponensis]|uniref:LysR family transcriptional regulator n=1 Tax=Leisingera daeponensis TaxID=405746 RepID=UPI001C939FB5|nr:LysR family transcriptional regulator [Leisingera daeponensis]MBY6059008.1 LysR family transcriptional regulator [Leisingera daeponensis]
MIEHLKSIAVFAEVVRAGQFRAAADRLKMTPSAVSYHVRILEEAVGVPLLYRSTRRFTLTVSGARLFDSAEVMLNAAETGFSAARPSDIGLSGMLRVTLTTALSHSFISKRITRFSMENPNVDLHLHYDNRETDLVAEGIDVALRIGSLRDSSLLCKHLWDMPRILVAGPEFANEHGPFAKPEDLRGVPWIQFTGIENKRVFIAANGAKSQVEQAGNLTVNSIEAMVDLTLNGAGLSSPPKHFVESKVVRGELVHCLPDYKMTDLPVYGIWHRTTVPDPLVKRFVDCLWGPSD